MTDYADYTDYAKLQRDVLRAGEKADQGLGVGVDTDFFPLDYMPEPQPSLDKVEVDTRTKIDLLKSYVEDVSEAESSARQKTFLAKQAHYADLTWILSEVNGMLIHLVEDAEYGVIPARIKLRSLANKIQQKVEETR